MTALTPMPDPTSGDLDRALAAGHDTGFWDDHGRPAPWPDDIDEWRPATGEPITVEPRRTTLLTNPTSKDQPLHHVQGLDPSRTCSGPQRE